MQIEPKVSIVIPVYNRADLVLETVKSAQSQTYKNIEIIIVDNKSTDNTFDLIQTYAKLFDNITLYQNDTNIGIVGNWRKCVDYAKGEYIHILWSDDLISPTFIERTIDVLINNEDVSFVYTRTQIFNVESDFKEEVFSFGKTGIYEIEKFNTLSLLGNPLAAPVSPANALFRNLDVKKNLLLNIPNKIGADYSMLGIGNDVLIFLLTGSMYPNFAYIDETLSFFRNHDKSITLSTNRFEVAIYYHIAKAYFVENYHVSEKIRRKFNARILVLQILQYFFNSSGKNKISINSYINLKKTNFLFAFVFSINMLLYLNKRMLKRSFAKMKFLLDNYQTNRK